MSSYYFQGLVLGAAIILPFSPRNAFMMNRGVHRQYHIMIALPCAISDLVLICTGIFDGSALLMQPPWSLALATWGGVAFLPQYGFGTLKAMMSSNIELASAEVPKRSRWKTIAAMSTITWLNPHVHLDTSVVLDSLGGQFDVEPKRWSALGTISVSFLQFSGLAVLAVWLASRLHTTKSQHIINLVAGCVMWFTALQLARDDITHAQTLFSQALSDGKIKQRRQACFQRFWILGKSINTERLA